MDIQGVVEHILFRNKLNGYTALVVDCDGEMVNVCGNFPSITEGENVMLSGDYKQTKYGMQFHAEKCKFLPPSDEAAIVRYLGSGLIKGIGEVTAVNIVKMFKKDTLEVIEKRPNLLTKVRGISAKKAVEIANAYNKIKTMQDAVMFLQSVGISTNMSLKIFELYQENTQNIVMKNPYRLIEDIDGIGFSSADKIAIKLGYEQKGNFRLRAGVVYTLKEFSSSTGSTYLPLDMLLEKTGQLLNVDINTEVFSSIIKELAIDMQIKIEDGNICLYKMYITEKAVAKRLLTLRDSFTQGVIDIRADIERYEKLNGINFHENQKAAIENSLKSGVAVITGGPGTGKTTIINCILTILKQRSIEVDLVAPTGRAAKRLSETTGQESKTIHRLLDIDFKDGKGYFTFNEKTRLPSNAVIVDEVSMVDVFLMNSLLSAINPGSRLILVGDKDQLPSVGAGNILGDIISSEMFCVTPLTEIYRQDSNSLIITNAHRINSGQMPILKNDNKDFFFSNCNSSDEILQTTLSMVKHRIPKYANCLPSEIQVLCPMKKGIIGSININEQLQNLINPKGDGKTECVVDKMLFRMSDKVMQTVNNYQMEWVRYGTEKGKGVYNGDIGCITDINNSMGEIEVTFDDSKICKYSAVDALDLSLAYSISIHKSQGSEFDIVIIPLSSGHKALYTRNLLYTAVTRAKKMVVLAGSKQSIQTMVDNDYTEKRYTMLNAFLRCSI